MTTTQKDERMGVPSASGIERLSLCPGSFRMEKGQPDKGGEAAEAGTRIHAMLETGEIPLEADDQEAHIAELCAAMENRILEEFGIPKDYAPWIVEERLIYRAGLRPLFTGKPDKVYYNAGHALIIDYKTGRSEYEPAGSNLQLRALAVALSRYALERDVPLEAIGVAIVQPYSKGDRQIAVYDNEALGIAEKQIRGLIEKANAPDAPLNPGEKQCRWCKARDVCPAVNGLVTRAVAIDPMPPAWDMLPAEQKAEMWGIAALAEKWAASVRARCREDLEAGIAIPGLALKDGATRRAVVDPAAVQQWAFEKGVSPEDFAKCCTIKLGDFEKTVKQASGMTAKAVKEAMDSELTEAISATQSKPTVVRVD